MKAVRIILTAAAVFLLTNNNTAAQNNREAQVVFLVNLNCHSCEQNIKKNIPYERGVIDLNVNLEKKLVTIKYRPNSTDKEKLKKAIEKLGFTCEEIKPENVNR